MAPPRSAAECVARFEETWANPSAERLAALAHPAVVLVQPAMRTLRGRAEAERGWGELFQAMPDLRGEVHRWSGDDQVVFIELTLRATVARRPFEWTLVDRIRLEDGLVRERVSYFDPTPLLLETLKSPSKWPRLIRLMLGGESRHGPGRDAR